MLTAFDPRHLSGAIFLLGVLVLVTIVLVAVASQVGSTRRSRASARPDEAYRRLTQQAIEAQAATSAALAAIAPRLAAIEKILRDVG